MVLMTQRFKLSMNQLILIQLSIVNADKKLGSLSVVEHIPISQDILNSFGLHDLVK